MYAANLAQKARELKREKRKSDTLLFQMLPPSVAQQLKQTQQVVKNVFNCLKFNCFFKHFLFNTYFLEKCSNYYLTNFTIHFYLFL